MRSSISFTPVLQRFQAILRPRLHVIQAVIGLRQDMAQPAHRQLSQTQTLPVALRRKVLIQQLRHLHLLLKGQQDRHIINPFAANVQLWAHAQSLSQSLNLVEK